MRNKTNPRARATPTTSRDQPSSGLVAKSENDRQPAEETCVLDNRSHRTPWASPAARERALSGARPC